ncbi:YbdK family carboxylate-amine ligase [Rhodanobacter sp. AS-Z3]|uniref:carboxylate-amine ligase n=1 Tax=Rhodanobacter sp. AS-Z3 TaxID=3031330 RepID=UPI002478913F|nr:YbdK family carboxylate-amine ligase [Rhodanobacter sp. AS-Z3]WEN14812.1 YbdK family carboxylate-amine ligase [Rhodanobacter sp. AS-Z3]
MLTLGIEEEVQIVDSRGELVAHDLTRDAVQLALPEGELDREIHRCVIELKTRVCRSVPDLLSALDALRMQARRRAAAQGQSIIVAGLHPTAKWQAQPMHLGAAFPHYAALVQEYQDVARSAFSFGMHLHLGLPVGAPRMAVMNRLRHVLPEVLALSASSPFLDGNDTGLQSWRHSLLDRYPRMGTPDAWDSDDAYTEHVQRLRGVGCIGPEQALWQDLRLHHRYGTLEVRIMDTHPQLRRIGLIATLLAWETQAILQDLQNGRAGAVWSRACIDENKWRARRHGLRAQWIDWDRDEACDTPTRFARWWARLAPQSAHAAECNYWARELADALDEGSFADRLRARAASDADWPTTLRWMMESSADCLPALPQAGGWR